jgi:peptide/nickel transport system substrate-binding protein
MPSRQLLHAAVRPMAAGLLIVTSLAAGTLTGVAPGVQAASSTSANTLTIGWSIETKNLNPVTNSQNPDIWVQVNIYERLVQVSKNFKTIVPDLATSWSVSKNSTVYTFHLRSDARFSNGKKVTAADVAFAINRARKPATEFGWTLKAVKAVTAPNPSTVNIVLSRPWAPLLSDLSLYDVGVYPKAYFTQVGDSGMSVHPIGSGPYMLSTWKKGQYLRLVKNPYYFDAKAYPMQYVEYDLLPNDTTRLLKVESGELDVDNVLAYNLIPQVQRNSSVTVAVDPSTQISFVVPNDSLSPWNDLKVRQAVNHAINRAALVKSVVLGHGTVANTLLPKGAIDYDPNIPVPTYSMSLAKKLLAESSHPHGFTSTFEVAAGNTTANEIAIIMKQELAPLGIKLNLVQQDPTTLFNNQEKGKFHLTTSGWTNDIPDPDELISFGLDYTTGNSSLFSFYNSPLISKLSHQAEATNNAAARQALYYRIQQLWATNVPYYALYYTPFINAVNKRVHGFSETPLGYFYLQGVTKS